MKAKKKFADNIPDFVKEFRGDKLTQRDLANVLGYQSQYVWNVENGLYPYPSKFCEALLPHLNEKEKKHFKGLMLNAAINATVAGVQRSLRGQPVSR